MLPFDNAQGRILSSIKDLTVERIYLQKCLGRISGEEIISPIDIPQQDIAGCDGYAIKSEDINNLNPPERSPFKVVGSIHAGSRSITPLSRGEAIHVMTGALLPEGADTVIKEENTRREGEKVFVLRAEPIGSNIRKKGSQLKKGTRIVLKGEKIGPITMGILASVGKQYISVFQKPRVSIISTGDELIELGKRAGKGRIYPSNLYSLSSLIIKEGAIPVIMGIVRDNVKEIKEKLRNSLGSDMICITGGSSGGEKDLVRHVLDEMGWKMAFWGVKMRPGHSFAFGVIEKRPIFCIPGNPGAVRVVYEEFLSPAIRKMMGMEDINKKKIEAKLGEGLRMNPEMRHFINASAFVKDGQYWAYPIFKEEGGSFIAMKRANSLIIYPEGKEEIKAGEIVSIQLI